MSSRATRSGCSRCATWPAPGTMVTCTALAARAAATAATTAASSRDPVTNATGRSSAASSRLQPALRADRAATQAVGEPGRRVGPAPLEVRHRGGEGGEEGVAQPSVEEGIDVTARLEGVRERGVGVEPPPPCLGVADAGRRRDDGRAAQPGGAVAREVQRDAPAERVADDVEVVRSGGVSDERGGAVEVRGDRGRAAVPREVDGHDATRRRQPVEQRPHRRGGLGEAVHQHDRRPLAGARRRERGH